MKHFPRRIFRVRFGISSRAWSIRGVNEMSLLRYLKPYDGLSDPRGSLSTTMSRGDSCSQPRSPEELNATKKCGQYKKYSPAQRSAIGRYSSVHGAAATAKHFSKLWGCKLNDRTVNSIKKAYLDELVISRALGMHGIYCPQPSKLWEACNLSNQTTNWLLSNGNTTRAL